MNPRPFVILMACLTLPVAFASACFWGADSTPSPTSVSSSISPPARKPLSPPALSPTPTSTLLPTSTAQPTQALTNTPTLTSTPSPAPTMLPTSTPSPTATPTPTSTPSPTLTSAPANTATPIATPSSTATPTATPAPIPTSTPSPTPIPTPSFAYTPCNSKAFSRDSPFSLRAGNYYRKWQDNFNIQWTPDGSKIFFTRGTGIYAVDADASRLQTIVDPSINSVDAKGNWGVGRMTNFDISPDGSQIVYSTCRYPDSYRLPPSELESWEFSYEIVVSNINGTNTRRLTNNNHFDNFPVWSPDGSQIAFVSDSDPDHDASEIRGRLMVYTMSTGESRDITPFYGDKDRVAPHPPAWSPDGQSIAFVAYDGDDVEYDYRGDVRSQGYPFVHTVLVDGRGSRTIGRVRSASRRGLRMVRVLR